MSEKLLPKTPTIKEWLAEATHKLIGVGIGSAKLDAEIILAHTLRVARTHLHAHDEQLLAPRQLEIADARLALRLDRTPIAYIIGHKEFYGRLFRVNPATLIPRPESEAMIEMLLTVLPKNLALLNESAKKLVDVGTGSGCLGITAKLEAPELDVTLVDVSNHALKIAEVNARELNAEVSSIRSDLLQHYPFVADYILANLPYVDYSWDRSPETNFEPELALFAEDNGLQLINKLLSQTTEKLATHGYILLEADPRQHTEIIKTAKQFGLMHHETKGFIVCLKK